MKFSSPAVLLLLFAGTVTGFNQGRPSYVRTSALVFADSARDLREMRHNLIAAKVGYMTDVDKSQGTFTAVPRAEGIKLAQGYLGQIEEAASSAKEYLSYLQEVATTVRAYLDEAEQKPKGASLSSGRPDLPDLQDPKAIRDYLMNIEKATSAAQDYLSYLENVASDVREQLAKLKAVLPPPTIVNGKETHSETSKALLYLDELENTVNSAKEYLNYLKGVASAVKAYLADPNNANVPEIEARNGVSLGYLNIGARSTPVNPSSSVTKSDAASIISNGASSPNKQSVPSDVSLGSSMQAKAPNGASYLDNLASSSSHVATPSVGAKPSVAKKVPGTGSYLDSVGSAAQAATDWSTFTAPKEQSHSSTTASAKGVPSGASYLSNLGGGAASSKAGATQRKNVPSGASYLDSVGSAQTSAVDWSTFAAPKSHSSAAAPAESSYLSNLGGAAAASSQSGTTPGKVPSGASYLDSMGSTPKIANVWSSFAAPKAKVNTPSPVKSAPSSGTYLSNLGGTGSKSSASPAKKAPSGASYLDSVASASSSTPDWSTFAAPKVESNTAVPVKSAPTTGRYLGNLGGGGSASSQSSTTPGKKVPSGASYLDSMGSAANTATDWSTFAAPKVQSKTEAAVKSAPTTGSYLGNLGGTASNAQPGKKVPSGASYLENLAGGSKADTKPSWGASVGNWLGGRSKEPVKTTDSTPKASGGSYLDHLSGSAAAETKPSAPSSGNYLDNLRNGSTATASATKSAPGGYLDSLEKSPRKPDSKLKGFIMEDTMKDYFFAKVDDAAKKQKTEVRKEPIPPELPVLGREYMETLKTAAKNNPNVLKEDPARPIKNDYDWDEKFKSAKDWSTTNVPGKTEPDLKSQFAALNKVEDKFKEESKAIDREEAGVLGFNSNAEMLNGRVAMIFLVLGLMIELWTGTSLPEQLQGLFSFGSGIDLDQVSSIPLDLQDAWQDVIPTELPPPPQDVIIQVEPDLDDWSF